MSASTRPLRRQRRSSWTRLATAAVLLAAGCQARPAIHVSLRWSTGDVQQFAVAATTTTTSSFTRTTGSTMVEAEVELVVTAASATTVEAEMSIRRQADVRRLRLRLDHTSGAIEITEIGGLSRDALGSAGTLDLPLVGVAPPAQPVAAGDRWTTSSPVTIDGVTALAVGKHHVRSFGRQGGHATVTIDTVLDVDVDRTMQGEGRVVGTNRAALTSVYDLDRGRLLRRTSMSRTELVVTVPAPDSVDVPAVTGTITTSVSATVTATG